MVKNVGDDLQWVEDSFLISICLKMIMERLNNGGNEKANMHWPNLIVSLSSFYLTNLLDAFEIEGIQISWDIAPFPYENGRLLLKYIFCENAIMLWAVLNHSETLNRRALWRRHTTSSKRGRTGFTLINF